MSYVRLWRYTVAPGREADFVAAYAATGDWAQLFARHPGFLGTELLRAVPPNSGYITLDRWHSVGDWHAFLAEHTPAYQTLGARLADLTIENVSLGSFERVAPP